MSIADTLAEGRVLAIKEGIRPRYALLGPVKYLAWKEWVKDEVNHGTSVQNPKGIHETFWKMIIVPSKVPGVIISECAT